MEYLTFALPLGLLLTWLGWQIWDERRSRQRRETELRVLAEDCWTGPAESGPSGEEGP